MDATAQKSDLVEQEYLAYLFLTKSSNKLHSQLKKDVANDYSMGNTEAYPTDIHKALTLINEYKQLKIEPPTVLAQGTAFATKAKDAKKKAGDKRDAAADKFLKAAEWNALSLEEQEKIIESWKKTNRQTNHKSADDDKSIMSNKSMKSLCKTIKSLEKTNKKLPYRFQVWFSSKAITNIICLKNLIKCYRVTYDSEIDTTFVVHRSAFGLPDLLFEMHPCGLHVCYPKKMGQFRFAQTMEDNIKFFSKQQVAGAKKARELYEKLIYPSTTDFRAIVSAGGVPGSDVTLDDMKTAVVIWGHSVLKLKGNMTRSNAKKTAQSIVKVSSELIKLHQEVELAIEYFFVNNL